MITYTYNIRFIGTRMELIDLGLSSRYATCNLGANTPMEYGDYYAWGELEPKSQYDTVNYLYSVNGNNKYGHAGDCSRLDASIKTILDPKDDVAHIRLGGSWRLPSLNDISELHDKCSWRWMKRNEVKGYLVTSKVDGYTDRSIFLPAAGFLLDSEAINIGRSGHYWTSRLYSQNAKHAISTVFDRHLLIRFLPNQRYAGLPIRPVCD